MVYGLKGYPGTTITSPKEISSANTLCHCVDRSNRTHIGNGIYTCAICSCRIPMAGVDEDIDEDD